MNPSFFRTWTKQSMEPLYTSLNLSKPARTPAPATPRRMLAPAPFISDMNPSFFRTWTKQSMEPLYLTACPEVIIMRLRTVSMGYDMRPAVTVTIQPRMKERKTEALSPRTMGLMESERTKLRYRPWIPSDLMVLTYTSIMPLYCRVPVL